MSIIRSKEVFLIILSFIFNCFSSQWLPAQQQAQKTEIIPGLIHHKILDNSGPRSIHVLEINLANKGIQLTTAKALNLLRGNTTTSEQSRRYSHPELDAIAAINADFYKIGGIQVGIQIIDGIPVKGPSNHSIFAITYSNKLLIERVNFTGKILFQGKSILEINGINCAREAEKVILYNRYFGDNSATNIWGAELTLKYLEPFFSGDTVIFLVQNTVFKNGNQKVPLQNGCVISAHGKKGLKLFQKIDINDTLDIVTQFSPVSEPVKMAIGGIPRIIRDGKISIEVEQEGISQSFSTTRHPRTALGYSRNGQILFLVTVDGRQAEYSIGMSLSELSHFMLKLGCYQALNLDGGGSTTMVIADKVVNSPSDATGERAVANSLLILAPKKH